MASKKRLVTYIEAVKILNEAHQNDPEKSGKDAYTLKTIYNAVSSRRLQGHGPRHLRQVEVTELLAEFGPKGNKSA